MFQCDIEKQTTKPLLLDQRLEQLLQPPLESNTFLKAHFDGLVLIFPTRIAVLQFEGVLPQASIVMEVPLPQYCFNLQDFHSAYRFMGWTPEVFKFLFKIVGGNLNLQLFANYIT